MTANTIPAAEVLHALRRPVGVTRRTAADAVADLLNFDYNRSGSARWRTSPPETGILRPESLDSLRAHVDGAPLLYVVFSYETPIAVYVEGRGWWMENSKYSATTTTHQVHSDGVVTSAASPSTGSWNHMATMTFRYRNAATRLNTTARNTSQP